MKRKKKPQAIHSATNEKNSSRHSVNSTCFFLFLLAPILCVALYYRSAGFASRGLEYDEFWTLTHYVPLSVSSILTALATPNNHQLNSLLMKWSVMLLGTTPLTLRLPAFIAGVLLFLPAGFAVWTMTKNKTAVLITLTLFSSNGALIHFSQTARGYSLQVLLLTFLLMLIALHVKSEKDSFQFCGGIFAVAGFAIFALSTSILYIVPLSILHLGALFAKTAGKFKFSPLETELQMRPHPNNSRARTPTHSEKQIDVESSSDFRISFFPTIKLFMKQRGMMIAAYVALAISAAWWYGDNYSAFKAGQGQFSHLASLWAWLVFVGDTCSGITFWPIWIAATLPLFFREWRWVALSAIFAVAFPFFLVPLTKAGPVRTYIPIFIFTAISAGIGTSLLLDRLRKKRKLRYSVIITIILLLCLNGAAEKKRWTPTDWRVVVNAIRAKFGPANCVIYPPNPCYAILANFGMEAVMESFARLPKNDNETLVLVGSGTTLRGLDTDFQPATISIDERFATKSKTIAGINCVSCNLQRIHVGNVEEALNSSSPFFISISPWKYTEAKRLQKEITEIMRNEGVIMCDAWLSRKWLDQNGVEHVGYLLACPPNTSKASKQFLVNRFLSTPGISFHFLRP
jgi:hypothetical protein